MLIPQIQAAILLPSLGHGAVVGGHREPWKKKKKGLFYQRASEGTWFLLNIKKKKGSKMATVQSA